MAAPKAINMDVRKLLENAVANIQRGKTTQRDLDHLEEAARGGSVTAHLMLIMIHKQTTKDPSLLLHHHLRMLELLELEGSTDGVRADAQMQMPGDPKMDQKKMHLSRACLWSLKKLLLDELGSSKWGSVHGMHIFVSRFRTLESESPTLEVKLMMLLFLALLEQDADAVAGYVEKMLDVTTNISLNANCRRIVNMGTERYKNVRVRLRGV